MAGVSTITIDPANVGTGGAVRVVVVQDHYAVLENGFVIGIIDRYPYEQGWCLRMMDGSGGVAGPVPLHHVMQHVAMHVARGR